MAEFLKEIHTQRGREGGVRGKYLLREEGREGGREGGREEGREGGRKGGREGGRKGGREGGGREWVCVYTSSS